MIQDLLPRYYEARGENPRYEVLRSIVINGHEVAWMKYEGTVDYDLMKQGREGKPYSGYELQCECDFKEGVGWETRGDGTKYNLDGPQKCLYRELATHLRHLELRQEYISRFPFWGGPIILSDHIPSGNALALWNHVPEIIFDLIEKVKVGEFIGEDGNGASFWGGYLYVQTVTKITDRTEGEIWEVVKKLVEEKKISLEGAVIQPYREPPSPTWEESFRIEDDGWVGIASLPAHSKMEQKWQLDVMKPDGTPAHPSVVGPHLTHTPIFGPDVDDVASAEEELKKLICAAKAGN